MREDPIQNYCLQVIMNPLNRKNKIQTSHNSMCAVRDLQFFTHIASAASDMPKH